MLVTYVYNPNPKISEMKNLNLFSSFYLSYCSKRALLRNTPNLTLIIDIFRRLLSIFDAPNIVKQPFTNLARPMK